MKNLMVLFLFIIGMVLSGCAKEGDIQEDVDTIDGMADKYTQAIGSGNLEAIMSLMAEGVIMMPPNESTRTGKDVFQEMGI